MPYDTSVTYKLVYGLALSLLMDENHSLLYYGRRIGVAIIRRDIEQLRLTRNNKKKECSIG